MVSPVSETPFKDLCLDTVDPAGAAAFWAPSLGLRAEPRDGGEFKLVDGTDEHTVWINVVPEPRTVKQRVHLDVRVAEVSEVTTRGATVLDDTTPWTVLADPEGGELCAFVKPPAELATYRLYELVVDAVEPDVIARWWGARLGVEVLDEQGQGVSWLEPADRLPWEIVFQHVPEPKTVKNRIHLDLWGDVETLVAAGARVLRARDSEIGWDVLADPEGNEFCVFARP